MKRKAVSRTARHGIILELITNHKISSQAELSNLLAEQGIEVSQSTLSKDLLEIGAVRVRSDNGLLIYARPGSEMASDHAALESRLARICAEVLIYADASANLVVLKTPPGAAQYFASAIDRVANPMILGSIAGDDTVMVISKKPDGGQELVQWFVELAAR
ncbi:arginine repressor [Propionimicrobium lymphophilum]|uniref:Arginine repressor n=1 Tax=Propionimicrobium lymphophilum ACS-093-V-SCH5 TaxID=883161 RepID=S2W0K5_9ACTN|nr:MULTISPECIES: arginine repressor [Propionimicrobium]EPD33273.1 arginine repressor [Propionimicrobium lymphophilum ACS-093-V-SCH5]ETJ98594.1 arginine repressor [Propionimicrobium sp. BV2F7]MDK7710057.1 arginine repressor [Propionimicrobium lymphophilum]MDK7732694.1 arginine repressor [Propionimicrobium lymphophilum]